MALGCSLILPSLSLCALELWLKNIYTCGTMLSAAGHQHSLTFIHIIREIQLYWDHRAETEESNKWLCHRHTMTSRYKDHLFGAMSHCLILCNLLTEIWWSTRGQMCKSNKSIGRFLGIQPDNNIVYEPFWTVSEHIVAPAVKTLAPPWSRQSHLGGGQTVPCWRTSWRTSLQTYKMLKLGSRQDSRCQKDQFNWWINWRGPNYPTIVSLQDCHH